LEGVWEGRRVEGKEEGGGGERVNGSGSKGLVEGLK